MNRFKALGSALLFVPALALVSTQARAEFKCATPQTPFDRAACEKAAEARTLCASTFSACSQSPTSTFSTT